MENPLDPVMPSERLINEIKYYVTYAFLKRLSEQGKMPLDNCRQANVAIAEKYGVLQLHI